MAYSIQQVVSNGTLVLLDISIDYIERSEISVYFDDVVQAEGVSWNWVGASDAKISFSPAVPSGVTVSIKRLTDISDLRHRYAAGAAFTAQSIDESFEQVVHIAQEVAEGALGQDFYQDIDMHGHTINNLADAEEAQQAVTYKQLLDVAYGAVELLEEYVATEGQALFTLTQPYVKGSGNLRVYVNGLLQDLGTAYTETTATTVTFSEGLAAGDNVQFIWGVPSVLAEVDSDRVPYTPAGTGAVTTQVQSKLREVVSVKDFGAVAGTDATEAINKAIAYVSSLGGGTVTGPSSEEYFALNVRIKSGVILRGLRLVTLPTSTENLACITFDSSDVTDAAVEDCIIDGNAANQVATVVQCVSVNGSRNSVRGCTLRNGKRSGIELKAGISHIRIKDNHISDMVRFGIYHEYHPLLVSKYVTISGNTIERMGATGVNLITGDDLGNHSAGVQFWSITNNFVKDTGLTEAAGAIGGYSKNNKHVLIAYNVMENINNHLHHIAGENISVIGNIGRNIANTGVVVRAWPNDIGTGGALSKNIIVSNNQIDLVTSDDVSGYGIYVANSEGVTVSGNCISGTVKDGIYIAGEQLGRTIRTTDVTVGNNVISEADNSANMSHAAAESGINIENADQVALTGNSVRKTYDSGIRVAGSTDVTISGNSSCDSKASNGILVLQTATDGSTATSKVAINGNVCSGNFNFGILFSGVVDRAVVVGNICRNNLTGQIAVGSPTSTILANNAGYRTKNRGTNSVANGGTISHFMDAAPTSYRVTPTVANRVAAVTSVSSSTITVALHDNAGAAITVAEPVNWEVSAELM